MATNETLGTKENKKEVTEWHSIVAWGKLAEICGKYLSKGSHVYVEGRIQTRSWEDKTGAKRYTTEIVISQMKMLGDKRGSGESGGGPGEESPPVLDDDQIPF
jgi:single-strand DNA-binding protein